MSAIAGMFSQSFFHGTRADLKPGDLIVVGHQSNFTEVQPLSWSILPARWMRRSGAPSWLQAVEQNGFMSWNRPGRSRTTPT